MHRGEHGTPLGPSSRGRSSREGREKSCRLIGQFQISKVFQNHFGRPQISSPTRFPDSEALDTERVSGPVQAPQIWRCSVRIDLGGGRLRDSETVGEEKMTGRIC